MSEVTATAEDRRVYTSEGKFRKTERKTPLESGFAESNAAARLLAGLVLSLVDIRICVEFEQLLIGFTSPHVAESRMYVRVSARHLTRRRTARRSTALPSAQRVGGVTAIAARISQARRSRIRFASRPDRVRSRDRRRRACPAGPGR